MLFFLLLRGSTGTLSQTLESKKEKPKRLSLRASLQRKRFSDYVRNFAAQNRLLLKWTIRGFAAIFFFSSHK